MNWTRISLIQAQFVVELALAALEIVGHYDLSEFFFGMILVVDVPADADDHPCGPSWATTSKSR